MVIAGNHFPSRPCIRNLHSGTFTESQVSGAGPVSVWLKRSVERIEPTFPDDWPASLDEQEVVHDAVLILQIQKMRPTAARAIGDPTSESAAGCSKNIFCRTIGEVVMDVVARAGWSGCMKLASFLFRPDLEKLIDLLPAVPRN